VGVYLGHQPENSYLDGVASLVIGGLLATVAMLLAYESKGLLVGESADAETVAKIRAVTEADPAVEWMMPPLTMHLGPHEILLNLQIKFREALSAAEIGAAVRRPTRSAVRDIGHTWKDVSPAWRAHDGMSSDSYVIPAGTHRDLE
jgi:divalent metal cation (Fe/Co/Zn/Cd) transporter